MSVTIESVIIMSVNVVFSFQDGAIRHLQDMIGEPAFPSICLLHSVELPLRALFCHIDNVKEGKIGS